MICALFSGKNELAGFLRGLTLRQIAGQRTETGGSLTDQYARLSYLSEKLPNQASIII